MKNILVLCTFPLAFAFAQVPQIAVSNAASYQQTTSLEPGTIIAVTGSNLTNSTMTAPDPTHPATALGNVTVTVNGVPCELYYVSPVDINAVIDPSTPIVNPAVVNLQSPTLIAQTTITMQTPTSAGIFTLSATGSGDGAMYNAVTGNERAFSATTNGAGTYLAMFMTSLDISTPPTVWIGGISAPVQYSGFPGTYPGMQQINAQVPPQLQGAGRVEVVVQQGANRSNAVDAVILPNQPAFADDLPNTVRSRELAAVGWIPGTSQALVADENDDVVRVIDLAQGKVTHVIALPSGAQPVAIGVHGSGTLALVAERGRGSVALIDLTADDVINEFPTGLGAAAIAVSGDEAVIVNSDNDSVSFFAFRGVFNSPAPQVTATVAVGRLPRAVAVDSSYAYVTNESAGTVSILDLVNQTVVKTISLGVDVRPTAIQVLPDLNLATIAEPSAGPNGKLILLNTLTYKFVSVSANPDQTGGASSIVASGDQIYLANQTGGSITTTGIAITPDTQFLATDVQLNPANTNVDIGVRSLSIDSTDGWLLAACEGDGTVVATNLTNNSVVSKMSAVKISAGDSDDHSDQLSAPNLPTVTSVTPASVNSSGVPVSATLTIAGTNLTNAESVLLIDPATVASLAPGLGDVNRGNFGVSDPAITVTGIQASPDGTKLTVQIQIAPSTTPRARVIRVITPNGETSLTNAPQFSIG